MKRVASIVGEKFGKLTVLRELGDGIVLARCDCGTVKEYPRSRVKSMHITSCGCKQAPTDRVGQKFSHLTITKELGWGKVLAKCDCGVTKEYYKTSVVRGVVTNCGCMKKARQHIAGQVFGSLTVVKVLGNNQVLAKCTCGSLGEYSKKSLIEGYSRSCGCEERSMSKVGQTFGYLTILEELGGNRVLARCNCGTVKEYNKRSVVNGRTKSCGCIRRGSKLGQTYGRLTIIEELNGGRVIARCTCGVVKEYLSSNLVSGGTKSCGCLRRGSR